MTPAAFATLARRLTSPEVLCLLARQYEREALRLERGLWWTRVQHKRVVQIAWYRAVARDLRHQAARHPRGEETHP